MKPTEDSLTEAKNDAVRKEAGEAAALSSTMTAGETARVFYSPKDMERIRSFFSSDTYATETTGIVIEKAAPGYAETSLLLDQRHKNANHAVMGAVFFTMADFTFAVAANSEALLQNRSGMTVTLTSSIQFLRPAKGNTLRAIASAIRQGAHTSVYEIRIVEGDADLGEKEIARITTQGFLTARP